MSENTRMEYKSFVDFMNLRSSFPSEVRRLRGVLVSYMDGQRWYGMEMNVEITKVMRISRQPSPKQIMTDQKETGKCGIFQLVRQHDNTLCKMYT
jgi:hypothetical protein